MDTLGSRLTTSPLAPLAVAGAALGACATVALVDPNQPGRYPVCPFLAMTGRWCPGCGSLRGLHALINGLPGQALDLNALMVVAIPFLLYSYAAWALPLLGGPRLPAIRLRPTAGWALLSLIVAFWILRNIPTAPFNALAP
jgi:hypothetical protein